MTKKEYEDCKNFTKCWVSKKRNENNNVNVKDHCHITGKYRDSAHNKCNIDLQLIKKIPVLFHTLQNHDSRLIMQGLGNFNFKINVIPNGI